MSGNGSDDPTGELGPLFARSLRIRALCDRIEELEERMEGERFQTPAEVLGGIVEPLFTQLGWELSDPRTVVREFEAGPGKVDLALCRPPGHPRILVKIEASSDSAQRQGGHPFDDPALDAVQLAISEDGRKWAFHFPAGVGSVRSREFARFDIVRDPEEEVAEELESYLAFHAVKSGDALRQAQRRYRDRRFPAEAVAAWRRSLLGSEVLERFLAEMKAATGVQADRDRTQGFVRSQVDGIEWPADPPDPRPASRVMVGDEVWVYDYARDDLVRYRLVSEDPRWEEGEASAESPLGQALLGAREGEERELALPNQPPRRIRVMLIRKGYRCPLST